MLVWPWSAHAWWRVPTRTAPPSSAARPRGWSPRGRFARGLCRLGLPNSPKQLASALGLPRPGPPCSLPPPCCHRPARRLGFFLSRRWQGRAPKALRLGQSCSVLSGTGRAQGTLLQVPGHPKEKTTRPDCLVPWSHGEMGWPSKGLRLGLGTQGSGAPSWRSLPSYSCRDARYGQSRKGTLRRRRCPDDPPGTDVTREEMSTHSHKVFW